MQQPYVQNQQVPITNTQGALTQNPKHTNQTADQSQTLKTYEINKNVITVQILPLKQ